MLFTSEELNIIQGRLDSYHKQLDTQYTDPKTMSMDERIEMLQKYKQLQAVFDQQNRALMYFTR